ncbi:MAG TPA: SEC-C metal-binding domain-containing protein, partial [Pirellulales bacterium]|nr:SEC-C metal-binding domain-containing protein [Pirellulales bacterium]
EYDEVMDEQRKRVYGFRQEILDGVNCKIKILEMIDREIGRYLDDFLAKDYGSTTFAKWAGGELGVELNGNDYRGVDYETAERLAKDEAQRAAETQVFEALEENLPEDAEEDEWNWEALAKLANVRWKLSLRDRDLKKVGRDHVGEMLIERSRAAIENTDLSEGSRFLDPDYGWRTACGWVHYKFGIQLDVDEVRGMELAAFKKLVREKAVETYDEKETEYPVLAGLYHFTTRDANGQKRYDRERLATWARERFNVELNLDDLRNKQRDEIRAMLIDHSREHQRQANAALAEAQARVRKMFGDEERPGVSAADVAGGNGALDSLSQWLSQELHYELPSEELARLDRSAMEQKVSSAVEDRFRPEIRRMERALVLQLLDTAWKDHLLAMDHLRQSVGLRGYAQVDPKVEYKREGMRTFEQMWASVGERVTDLVFRMEQLNEDFVGSTWVEGTATHEEAPPTSQMSDEQQQALDGSEGGAKPEPIRNREEQVGRNDPCPCGSGKKYKNCHMRKGGVREA